MTIMHFTVYMAYPIIWTFRNGVGFLLDSNTVCLYCIFDFKNLMLKQNRSDQNNYKNALPTTV